VLPISKIYLLNVELLFLERPYAFGSISLQYFADCIKRGRPRPNDKWHLDEVVISIGGKKYWLWRAIDADGDVLDILVQARRNTKAARQFFKKLIAQYGQPRVVVTDKLRSYIKPIRGFAPQADHRAHMGLTTQLKTRIG
jgi:putative transposase